jgi:hypothetical protein
MPSRQYYNRYSNFLIDGEQTVVPYVTLPAKTTDKKFIYKAGQSRLDKISQQYYGSPYFGWLIMASNSIYGGQEWNIPDGSILTIPFPLVASLQDYKNALDNHFFYYGR